MKSVKRVIFAFCALAVCFVGLAEAAKNPEDIFVFDAEAEDWVLKAGGEPEGTPRGGQPDLGLWFYVVNADNDETAKGLENGVLLYNANAKKYSFLPLDEEQRAVDMVTFSPDGRRVVVAYRLGRFSSGLSVYEMDGLTLENTLMAYTDIYFVDHVRFAFTLIDQSVERPEAAGLWGSSAALYEPADEKKGYVELKGATAKESYAVMSADKKGITINITSVKTENDWEDVDSWQESEITVEVPAAGDEA